MLKATLTFKDYTPEVTSKIVNGVDRAVEKSLAVMERNIKVNTPVKHGTLKRSIQSVKTAKGEGEVNTGAGGSEVTYATYVEYGTRHMAPRAMFRKGVAQSQDQIAQIFDEELNQ